MSKCSAGVNSDLRNRCYVPIPPSRPSTRSLRGEEKLESCREEREDKSESTASARPLGAAAAIVIKVAGDTSTCPPPKSVTMEQTVTEGKRQGECPEKEKIVYGSERGKKTKILLPPRP